MIQIKDVVTLSDQNEYLVVSKVDHEDRNYYYLVDIILLQLILLHTLFKYVKNI